MDMMKSKNEELEENLTFLMSVLSTSKAYKKKLKSKL